MKLYIFTVLFLICVSKSYHMETSHTLEVNEHKKDDVTKHRTKRGVWDIFQKMFITKNLIVDQYTDTRDTLNEVYNLFNGQFTDGNPPKPTSRPAPTEAPKSSDEDTEKTTKAPYRISQFELGQVIGRNFRGLQRLAQLEFREALNDTKYNLQEYRAEASKQFANSLVEEKKKQINALMKG